MNHPSLSQCAQMACLLEICATKPGNVHRAADFEDVGFPQFALSAVAIGPMIEAVANQSMRLGEAILHAVQATRQFVDSNTNLGLILLLMPLARVPRDRSIGDRIAEVLTDLNADDAHNVYEAIRIAQPGGLGKVEQGDVHQQPPPDLIWAMRQAAQRDRIAYQYAHNFVDICEPLSTWFLECLHSHKSVQTAIIHMYLQQLASVPDTLIARKCGDRVANECASRAASVLAVGPPDSELYWQAVADLDFWLRSDGHQRNPGTTADLVAATLFVLLRDQQIPLPIDISSW